MSIAIADRISTGTVCQYCTHWGQTSYGGPFGRCCNTDLAERPPEMELRNSEWPSAYCDDGCSEFKRSMAATILESAPPAGGILFLSAFIGFVLGFIVGIVL